MSFAALPMIINRLQNLTRSEVPSACSALIKLRALALSWKVGLPSVWRKSQAISNGLLEPQSAKL
jgi:hypothetical protein